ncbi:hypothetical protein [Sulfuriroseicoccus oceanibius]|uniref:Glycosyltransferase RgtA/B/C/D-like domain-containing protein n=1 Tax=Sulfuriroseicoccus oceanibius TaxID=2707525 RepID=A0A6B3LFB0_9BACT|nr:hypothetical protein [Sulfuriroseicoccus oceanibius]QQL45904.1 hypothetical protein G3M56_004805 [Sulfuriroseicoccus oceanibius]
MAATSDTPPSATESTDQTPASAPPRKVWPLPKSAWLRLLITLVALALMACAYIPLGDALATQTNLKPHKSDQSHNMKLARIAKERAEWSIEESVGEALWQWMPHYSEGVVQPLWPRIASNIADDDDHVFLAKGKSWNLWFSGIFLALLAVLLSLRWSPLAVINFTLIAGFGAFLPRSVYFQPEPIYYALFLLSFLCALGLIKRNPLWLYAVFGIVSSLAYLAKGSMGPAVMAFFLLTTYRFLAAVLPRLIGKAGLRPKSRWSWQNHILGTLLFAIAFLFINGPSMSHRYERFGSPTHSFPSYWMWMDSFEEGYVWMGNHNTREKLAAMKPEDKPSLGNYLERHTPETAGRRLADGSWHQVARFFNPKETKQPDKKDAALKPWREILPDRGLHFLLLALPMLALTAAGWWQKAHIRRASKGTVNLKPWFEIGPQAIFLVGIFALYAMLHGWYTQVGDGERFMMALVAPMALGLIAFSEKALRRLRQSADTAEEAPTPRLARTMTWVYLGCHLTLTALIVHRLWQLLQHPVFAS